MKTKLTKPNKKSYTRRLPALLLAVSLSQAALADPREDADKGWDQYTLGHLISGMQLLQGAAEQGDARGQARLGYILNKAGEETEAVEWFKKSAAQNDPEGQYWLSKMYAEGEGIEQDLKRAGELIKLSAEQDYLLAMRVYGLALESGGMALEVDIEQARQWIKRAAEKGDYTAMRRLADAYQRGELGLAQDLEKAKHWETLLNTPKTKEASAENSD